MRAAVLFNDDAHLAAAGAALDRIAREGATRMAEAVADALARRGFEAIEVPSGDDPVRLAARLQRLRPALVFNVCESFAGDARREAAVAALLELLGLPYTGSTPLALGIAQDKALAKRVLAASGVPIARSGVLADADDPLPADLRPPLFVKARFEDASHGIAAESVCATVEAARERARELIAAYAQDAIVEEYLPGREINVGILGGECLPLAEIDYSGLPAHLPPIVTYEAKWVEGSAYYAGTPVRCPASVDPPLAARIREVARAAHAAIGCRDYARVDIRLGADGAPRVLEVNPNPDISPDAGLANAARAAGIEYEDLVHAIARAALARGAAARHATAAACGALVGAAP